METSSGVLGAGRKPAGATPTTTIHVEVCQRGDSAESEARVRDHVVAALQGLSISGSERLTDFADSTYLGNHVDSICVEAAGEAAGQVTQVDASTLDVAVYRLSGEGPAEEMDDDENVAMANHWVLPAAEFHGLWESLVYDEAVKAQLLSYVTTTLLFSDRGVNSNLVAWNRVVLLHGPPGTGKTSLCKALAQKLSIRLSGRFRYGQLIEINSHSLFSKWFSESGKLVMKMFQQIQEAVEDEDALVCVLIDEVESLTAARKSAMAGSEPSDAIRVVNALLTQIDKMKNYKNVVILTTSNVTGAIDLAFVDRADIKQYIGPPSWDARYAILLSCVEELMRVGIVDTESLLRIKSLRLTDFEETAATANSLRLYQVAKSAAGFSGRTLRKLPFLAHAKFVPPTQGGGKVSLDVYLSALESMVHSELHDRARLLADD